MTVYNRTVSKSQKWIKEHNGKFISKLSEIWLSLIQSVNFDKIKKKIYKKKFSKIWILDINDS